VGDLDDLVLDRVDAGHLVQGLGDTGLVAAGGDERQVELAQVLTDQAALGLVLSFVAERTGKSTFYSDPTSSYGDRVEEELAGPSPP